MRSSARDFRNAARIRLKGNWGIAILVCIVAALLGGLSGNPISALSNALNNTYDKIQNTPYFAHFAQVMAGMMSFAKVASIWGIITFIIGGAFELGVCTFHTRMSMGERPSFEWLFDRFGIFLKALGLRLFMGLFILLWSILLIIPGIVAGYRYSMAPFLMAEYPQIGIREAVDRSKQLMDGNKGRLFCLQLSFIGWWLLSALTFGIVGLWIAPYMQTAQACFYLELTGRSVVGSTGNQW